MNSTSVHINLLHNIMLQIKQAQPNETDPNEPTEPNEVDNEVIVISTDQNDHSESKTGKLNTQQDYPDEITTKVRTKSFSNKANKMYY